MIMNKKYMGAMMHIRIGEKRASVDLLDIDENAAKKVGAAVVVLNSQFEPEKFRGWVTYAYAENADNHN